MSNAIRCIDQRFAFKNSRILCLVLTFKLKNPSKITGSCMWRNMTSHIPFFSLKWYELMAQWLATWVWFLQGAETSASIAILLALNPSVHWHARFLYSSCCTLYYIFFLGFRQWRSRADKVVNLNTTILFALFWRTWTWAWAHTHPHVLASQMGRDYSDCRASELTDCQVSGFVFFWFLENTEKTTAS